MLYLTPSGHVVTLDNDVAFSGRLSIGSHGYAQLTRVETGVVVLLHRWLLGLTKGDRLIGDHINGDKLDCRRVNLRIVTPGESSANVSAHGSSGFRGVYPTHSGRWMARAKLKGKIHNLGTFDNPEEAAVVAREWRQLHMPGFVVR